MEAFPNPLEIRNACAGDAEAMATLVAVLGYPAPADVIASRLEEMVAANEIVLVAARDDAPIGLLTAHATRVLHRPTPVGRLTALVVTESERGQGIGRALVDAAERLLAARGCALVEVTSHRRWEKAHAFYERLGYQATSVRFGKDLSA